jgi:predicted CxxxxCH...CXXCH cytochrome family protein
MERKKTLYAAKAAVILSVVPILIWAHEYGPDAGYSGVPKELGTCTAAQCHVGTTNNPANQGSVSVAFAGGPTYLPGVKQHLVVTVADPVQRAWGFQLTARLASNSAGCRQRPRLRWIHLGGPRLLGGDLRDQSGCHQSRLGGRRFHRTPGSYLAG